ncbi:tRNA 2-thiouridine(34) synthase MnmA [Candidatus Gracilibacteria bacterium]|nr:tRNA 2-thiouridine(34) synthase MnmA [Candidatus Gracilibacteria bacterium]
MNKKTRILVGLSGGVDSAVSAYLLKKEGYDVACGFMINYLEEENPECTTLIDLEEAKKVATFLELPLYTFDYREEYEKRIIDYIYQEYKSGRTPNPDVFCNNLIKFDLFLNEAISLGFDKIATGHYAQKKTEDISGEAQKNILLKGLDPSKDQSYFLSRLSDFQLSKALFPIGNLLKSEVRKIATEAGLPNAERKDSQGLCFIGKVSMKEFLSRRFPKNPGDILTTDGAIIGKHEGAFSYTIGQRKGIEIGGGPALFVVAKDTIKNTITVGTSEELSLYGKDCLLSDWIGEIPETGKAYGAKIRYRQIDQACEIKKEIGGNLHIFFTESQRAITPGQICVVYDSDRVVGSGVIL